MTNEQAIERLKKMIQINNSVIKEARKNGDIFAMQLTADLDTDSIAIEKVLTMLEEKDKIIDLMADYISDIDDEMFCDDEDKYDGRDFIGCDEDCQKCVIEYFENKAKEEK